MRLDKYLKVSRLIKRRTVANEACDNGLVTVNGKPARASYEVKEGDQISLRFGVRTITVEVLSVQETVRQNEAAALYRHNEQSLRVVETIENGGRGLNLMPEVRDGILCHTGPVRAETLEGRIVAVADRIAYVNHDIDDAIRAGVLREGDLPPSTHEVLGCDHSSRIETLVVDAVRTSAAEDDIRLSPRVWDAMAELREFLFDNVYTCDAVMEEVAKAMRLIDVLFSYYIENPGEIPVEYRAISEGDDVRAATDYIAGMTDRYAKSRFQNLFEPHSLHV